MVSHRAYQPSHLSHSRGKLTTLAAIAIFVSLTSGCATQHEGTEQYQPLMAQSGKDVMWMPTANKIVTEMLDIAQVNSTDLVYDLGAGDGKIPIEAAKRFNARAVGIEFNPNMAALARRLALEAGVSDRVTIVTGDIFEEDFSNATVVTLYLLTQLNIKLKPKLLAMKPGTRVVSNTFGMGSWQPDEVIFSGGEAVGYFWIVPAKIEGQWNVTGLPGMPDTKIKFVQRSQKVDGDFLSGDAITQRFDGKLRGSQLTFEYRNANNQLQTFVGEVSKDSIHGSIRELPGTVVIASRIQ